jgi:hypothetical protein
VEVELVVLVEPVDPVEDVEPVEPVELVEVEANEALIVWFAITFLKVYELTAPTDAPSTLTSAIL